MDLTRLFAPAVDCAHHPTDDFLQPPLDHPLSIRSYPPTQQKKIVAPP
jgi:hypothetical protein